ncbi:MAG TPA: flagellar motor protein MotA [Parvibaculum sp.]|uniref:flagellar motor protein MotA n=1 Tax=Parvibaculum sp. TaxID=2024848 RepID=UPI002BFF040F|nr:flagellar motor protein MotA [Parvibaculum sp.]HMM13084.1 flagellar motor protein MotA [Parvibaculum sp.]
MAKDYTGGAALSTPRPYLVRMILFLLLVGFLLLILSPQLKTAYFTNPGLNTLIIGVLTLGILYGFRQILVLGPEVRWVNAFRRADPGLAIPPAPRLLAPMATMLGERKGRMQLNALTMRSLLDSIGSRLDEQREISRYMIGLLIFLGLLGTFWGLLTTVTSVGATIHGLNIETSDPATVFQNLKAGLEGPLSGMGTSFSSSLFGLAGSLILGFLDLQAGQAQNRFYNELEEWLSTVTDISGAAEPGPGMLGETLKRLERIEQSLTSGGGANSAPMLALAGQITALTEQIKHEQLLIRRLAENQEALRPVLDHLAASLGRK